MMIVVEVFPDGVREPIRFVCVPRGLFAYSIGIIISDDDAPEDAVRYRLYVSGREADIDAIADFYELHYGTDGEGGGIPLAENGDALGINLEECALGALTPQELLFPLVVDELNPGKGVSYSHGYH